SFTPGRATADYPERKRSPRSRSRSAYSSSRDFGAVRGLVCVPRSLLIVTGRFFASAGGVVVFGGAGFCFTSASTSRSYREASSLRCQVSQAFATSAGSGQG